MSKNASDPHEELPIVVEKRVNGNLIVPRGAYAPGIMGDSYTEIGPDDPSYESWMNRIERSGNYVQETRTTITELLSNAIDQAKIVFDDDKVETLREIGRDIENLKQYFAKELDAIEIQYQKDLVMAERAKRILEEKRAASRKSASKPDTIEQAPPENAATVKRPKPKKGKKPKGNE